MSELKHSLFSSNQSKFENNVEVHMQHIVSGEKAFCLTLPNTDTILPFVIFSSRFVEAGQPPRIYDVFSRSKAKGAIAEDGVNIVGLIF